jgi:GNAT superfamily N-acetyltransferase
VSRPGVTTWYLVRRSDEVKLAFFGLRPGFAGRGLGGALLAAVTQRAWAEGAGRVWLHTCSLDSPAALPAYERRGFRGYREDTT